VAIPTLSFDIDGKLDFTSLPSSWGREKRGGGDGPLLLTSRKNQSHVLKKEAHRCRLDGGAKK